MSAIGQTIKRLREEHGWTQAELGEKVDLDAANIGRRETGRTKVKGGERFRFAQAFNMSVTEFDQHWRQWSIPRTRGGDGIPVINRAPAGQVIDYEEYGVDSGQGFEYIDFGQITDPLAFAVIVVGESMQPALNEDDILVLSSVDPYKADPRLTNGRIVFVRLTQEHGGGCTLARFFDEGHGRVRLYKDNPKYAPLQYDRTAIQAIAIALERRVRF